MKYLNYIVFLFFLLFGFNSFAQKTDKTKSGLFLEQVVFQEKLKGFKKVLEEFNVTYENYLTKLEGKLKAKGELDQLLLVRKEKAEFRKGAQTEETKFVKLQEMRSIYSKGRESRKNQIAEELKPILNAHFVKLGEIRKALTKEDKIDEALIAKKEEDRIKLLMGDPKSAVFALGIFSDPFNTVVATKTVTTPSPKSVANKPDEQIENYIVGTEWEYTRLSGESRVLKFEKGKFQIYTKNENGGIVAGVIEPWELFSSKKRQLAGFRQTQIMTLNRRLTEMSWGGANGDAVTAKLIKKDFSNLSRSGFKKWLLEQSFDFHGKIGGLKTLKFDEDKVNYGGYVDYDYEVTGIRELEISKTPGNVDFKIEFSKDLQKGTFTSDVGVYPVRINAKD